MRPIQHWLDGSLEQRKTDIRQLFGGPWPPANDYIRLVRAPANWGVFASTGHNFQYALFGRDAIETAEDLLETHCELVRDIILDLCKLQGIRSDSISEEEPGKIHHEHRAVHLDGFTIPEYSQQILRQLQNVWGGAGTDEMRYFGAHDTTPLFVRLINRYVQVYGPEILDEQIMHKDGHALSVRECVHAAMQWLTSKIITHPLGLFAYRRLNPNGIPNQDWKDSPTSHLHADGSMPNFDAGVVSIELQGLAYDALLAGVHLNAGSSAERAHWAELAQRLQAETIKQLWRDDIQYFAQGLELDENNNPHTLDTITSDPAAMLDSGLIHDLPSKQATYYNQQTARMVFSKELLTNIGVRCRAVQHFGLLSYIDYHGPNTVWPKETFDVAKGLRRAGLRHLALNLEHRLAKGLAQAGEFYEFFYVGCDGKVWYNRDEALSHFGTQSPGHALPVPEPGQAWTIAAAVRIAYANAKRTAADIPPPTDFEQSLLASVS